MKPLNRRLSVKIIAPLAALAMLALLLLGESGWLSSQQLGAVEAIYSEKMVPLNRLRQIQLLFREIEYRMAGVMSELVSPVGAQEHLKTTVPEIGLLWEDSRGTLSEGDFSEEIANFSQGLDGFRTFVPTLINAYDTEDTDLIEEAIDEWYDYKVLVMRSIDAIVAGQEASVARFYQEEKARIDMLTTVGTAIAIILILVVSGVGVYIARGTVGHLLVISGVLREVEKSSDLALRCEGIDTGDEVEEMGTAFNALMERLQTAINETNQTVERMAKGDFEGRVTSELNGDLLLLKQGVNGSAEQVEHTMRSLIRVMEAISEGDLGYRIGQIEAEGDFRLIFGKTMLMMETMGKVVSEINRVMQAVAEGDFEQRVEVSAQGDLNRLKRNINQSLDELSGALQEVVVTSSLMGEGDLTRAVEGEYQGALMTLKESINLTQGKLAEIVGQVRDAAHTVRNSAQEVSNSSQNLSERTSEQAASLEETASSIEQMSSTVSMNADNSAQANQLAEESLRRAQEGAGVVSNAVKAMGGINESSSQISEIITLIDGIAFQTNLLALNAAVEAARAGEHGRGFAVVAGEVRTLAQRSADAAKDIKMLIEDSAARIQNGTDLVSRSGEALGVIRESVAKVNSLAAEIAVATREQNAGINQVNNTITLLDRVTQENAALVEESAAAGSQLSSQADALTEMVAFFKTG